MVSVFTHRTLREEVALFLRNKILNGEIKPGEKINEVELSKELNISRGPVREALRQIEQEGLVDYMPNKGCTVKIMTPDDMSEAYLIMLTLETLAVRVCGGIMRPGTIERLEELARQMGSADRNNDLSGIVENDHLFHKTIVDEAGLKRLSKLWSGFDGENAAAYYTMDRAHLMPHNYIEYNHRLIIDALKSEDLDRAIDVISEHYMVVPRDLYRHNSAEPGKLTEIGRLR